MRTYEVTECRIMTLTQQWRRYPNLSRNTFHILLPTKDITGYEQIIPSRLYVRLKGTCSLAGRAILNTGDQTKYLKIPEKHRRRHKMSSRATCWDPCNLCQDGGRP